MQQADASWARVGSFGSEGDRTSCLWAASVFSMGRPERDSLSDDIKEEFQQRTLTRAIHQWFMGTIGGWDQLFRESCSFLCEAFHSSAKIANFRPACNK